MTTPSPLMSPEAYLHACGGCCPVCRSGQIVGESFDAEAAQVWQRLRCLDCEAVWTAVYALQGYADLERPGMIPQKEQARLLREVLLNRSLNPYDVLDVAAGVEAALLALPAIQAHIQAAWEEEQQLSLKTALRRLHEEQPSIKRVALLIGPEGGFAEQEIALARESGATSVTLGKRILRAETAALVTVSNVLYELES